MELRADLTVGGIAHDVLLVWNESLIQRARNNIATTFLETDFQKLMFVDSDIEFRTEDVATLWNMDTDVAVGLYPMKRPDSPTCAWVGGKMVEASRLDGVTEVDYAGTGFMMIDRGVLEEMRAAKPELEHWEGVPGEKNRRSYAWFNPRVDDDVYLSEDYAFCKDARACGFKVLADPSIKLTHHGSFAYR